MNPSNSSGYKLGKYRRAVLFNSNGTLAEPLRVGDGGSITNLPASSISTGRLDVQRMPNPLWNYQVPLTSFSIGTRTGSGGSQPGERHLMLMSGATAGSTARRALGALEPGWPGQSTRLRIDWSVPFEVWVTMSHAAMTTNGISRFRVGAPIEPVIGPLDRKQIGFEVRNTTIWLVTHDGTTLREVSTGASISAVNSMHGVRLRNTGTGTVQLFVGGVTSDLSSGGVSLDGPTGNGASNDTFIQVEVTNGTDAANHQIHLAQIHWLYTP